MCVAFRVPRVVIENLIQSTFVQETKKYVLVKIFVKNIINS